MGQERATATTSSANPLQEPPAGGEAPPRLHESLSQLSAKILDQLSVSAWLPSGALVFLLLLIGSVRHTGGHIHRAITDITSMNPASLILLAVAIVLTTTLTQAFEFESIRLLEGYWGAAWIPSRLADGSCLWQNWRRERLRKRLDKLERSAFNVAKGTMAEEAIPQDQIDVVEARKGYRRGHHASEADVADAEEIKWREFANPRDVRKLEALGGALAQYPVTRPILPTRLGNTLRSSEERIAWATEGKSLEGFVQRSFHRLPSATQIEHDQFRQRLDLYCALVVVFWLTGGAGVVVFWRLGRADVGSVAVLAIALSWLSYRAAIASARAYGGVLEAIADFIRPDADPG